MAAKKPKLNPVSETPTKKSDIDKMYIVEYTKLHGTPEQREKIKKAIQENTVERTSQLTKQKYKDIKLKEVREVFCGIFFPQLNTKKAKKDFFDLVDEL